MSDNEALNALVAGVENIASILTGQYDSLEGDSSFVAVSDVAPVSRAAVPTAVKAVVVNGGASTVHVYMNAVLVAIVPPGESKELPMAGTSAIQVDCATGESSQIAIAIFKKTV